MLTSRKCEFPEVISRENLKFREEVNFREEINFWVKCEFPVYVISWKFDFQGNVFSKKM